MEITTQTLAEQPFLKGLSESQLTTLLADALPSEFAEGEQVFTEGDPANRFYLLISGSVAVELPSEDNPERTPVLIETLGPGDVLGWSWLFAPYRWHFDARALTPVKAVFFYGTRLRSQCENDHELGYELMRRTAEVVVNRLHATRRRMFQTMKRETIVI